jgi:hypothetical protein
MHVCWTHMRVCQTHMHLFRKRNCVSVGRRRRSDRRGAGRGAHAGLAIREWRVERPHTGPLHSAVLGMAGTTTQKMTECIPSAGEVPGREASGHAEPPSPSHSPPPPPPCSTPVLRHSPSGVTLVGELSSGFFPRCNQLVGTHRIQDLAAGAHLVH